MRCAFDYCSEDRYPAVGIANLKGRIGHPTYGTAGPYPLCQYHYDAAVGGGWNAISVEGWEPLPVDPVLVTIASTQVHDPY